jgi:hypothetical protein
MENPSSPSWRAVKIGWTTCDRRGAAVATSGGEQIDEGVDVARWWTPLFVVLDQALADAVCALFTGYLLGYGSGQGALRIKL